MHVDARSTGSIAKQLMTDSASVSCSTLELRQLQRPINQSMYMRSRNGTL
jgi:hypothetical protein